MVVGYESLKGLHHHQQQMIPASHASTEYSTVNTTSIPKSSVWILVCMYLNKYGVQSTHSISNNKLALVHDLSSTDW